MRTLYTIGYQGAVVEGFLDTLVEAGVNLLVDVRRVASSRRPGFAKRRLTENLASVGIDYLHLRELGTPAEGRAAARSGRTAEMKRIVRAQLETDEARHELQSLADLLESGRDICILCFEADPAVCHRSIVAEELGRLLTIEVHHLFPQEHLDARDGEADAD
jgi:uncharacterized protein (DUF488 family)